VATQEDSQDKSGDEELLRIAKERYNRSVEAEHEIRQDALDDLKFSIGDQWPADIKQARDKDRRPSLTINRLPQFIRQITNDQRQNRPAIKVSPVDDKADIETAKIYQGIIRHIENASNADTAYDTAFDSAARAGFGYFRIVTEYCDPMSFEQEIRIKRVPDRFSVRLDPNYQEPDGSDAEWGFVEEDITWDSYKAQYPNSKLASATDRAALGDSHGDWIKEDTVRVTEYFFKEYREATICLCVDSNGQKFVAEKDKLPADVAFQVVDERKTLISSVKWAKINAIERLEKTDWPGKWIPIIPALGEEVVIEGKRNLAGVVRYAKDSQRMYNYWKSAETETIALAPRAPYIGAEGQFEGHEAQWRDANVRNIAFLQYKPKTVAGQLVPPPQRQAFEPPVQAITQAGMFAADDMKATTGVYDGALGAKSNETSGIAIRARNTQSQTSNFHLIDNLSKSIRHCGRQLVDLIPKVYDTDRAIRILGEDGKEEVIRINQEFIRNGKPVTYNLDVGKYDVSVSVGPSFETKRQEAVASMADMSRANPQLMQVAGDLMVQNMDWPGADEIAKRIRKTLPPNIVDDEKNGQALPPQVQQQMGQMNQMIEQLTQQLNEANEKVETKTLELESRERIEMQKLQVQLQVELAKLDAQDARTLFQAEIAQLEQRLNMLGQQIPFEHEFEGAGPEQGQPPMEPQQPTDGFSSGPPMEFEP
jgi:hypothetical protein